MKLSDVNHPLQKLICILDYYTIYYTFFNHPPWCDLLSKKSSNVSGLYIYLFIFCVHLAAALAKYNSSLSGASHYTGV